jgi:hypothetical protein
MSLLESIEFNAYFGGATTFPHSETACDKWNVVVSKRVKPAKDITLPYYTGTGHRSKKFPHRPVAPKAADVFESLLTDAGCGRESFREFCENLGYEMDSRSALDTYLACQEIDHKLRQLFGYGYEEKLRTELGLD